MLSSERDCVVGAEFVDWAGKRVAVMTLRFSLVASTGWPMHHRGNYGSSYVNNTIAKRIDHIERSARKKR
jgi:hypothetical protein